MTQTATNYAKVLYEIGIAKEIIKETEELFKVTPELLRQLDNPTVSKETKHTLIRKIFPSQMYSYLCVLVDYQSIYEISDIFRAYEEYDNQKNQIICATLYYVTAPDEEQTKQLKQLICNRFDAQEVKLELVEKPELLGGFVIQAGDVQIDQSTIGRIKELQNRLVWR